MSGAKPSYRIPYGLSQSYLDMTISLSSKDGAIARTIPMGVVGLYVISALSCLFIVMYTFVGTMSNVPQKVIFVILWALLTICLASYDGSHRMNIQRIPVLLSYIPKSARYVYTRTSKNASPFWNILGIEEIKDDGLVVFTDRTYGYWYRVVGSASILLFDSDKDAIISRVDKFYQKWINDAEICFVTAKEAQKVYRQLASLRHRYDNLKNDDPDLRDVAEEQFRVLKEYVGSEFKSIHQYMLIKANNMESLRIANGVVQTEIDNSSLMIKQCVTLQKEDVYELLKSIYQKEEVD